VVSLKLHNTLITKIAPDTTILEAAEGTTKILRCRTMSVQIGIASLELTR